MSPVAVSPSGARIGADAGGTGRPTVLRPAILLIVAALLFRAWALKGSWFYFDDLAFMSAGMNDKLDWDFVSRNYAGHLMPAGWLVIKALATLAPYEWPTWAALLLLMQAIASFGMFRLLRSMFGDTRAVLALLAGYCFYIFTVPAGVWFAAGINQLPLQIALVFGVHAHLSYLRTHSKWSLAAAIAWSAFGLAFYEKSALLFGLYALIALCWFSSGLLAERVKHLWERYRLGIIAYGCLAVPYVVIYLKYGLDFGSRDAPGSLISAVAYRLVGVALSTGAIGGPFEWRPISANALAAPSDLITLGSWVAVGSLIYYAARTRTASRRAWWLIGFTSTANVYLLATARANLVGADIGLEYRYQTEAAAVLVLSVGLALLPLRGADEVNAVREDVPRPFENSSAVRVVTILVVIGCVISTLAYVRNWQDRNGTKAYYDNARKDILASKLDRVPLVDLPVPQNMLWAFGYPENTYSHIFRNLERHVVFPDHAVDQIFMLSGSGRLVPLGFPPQRTMIHGQGQGCGYILHRKRPTTIPLDGPVVGGGWWIAMAYASPHDFGVQIELGDSTREMKLPAGMHTAYFKADGSYGSVVLRNEPEGESACITALVLGNPDTGSPPP